MRGRSDSLKMVKFTECPASGRAYRRVRGTGRLTRWCLFFGTAVLALNLSAATWLTDLPTALAAANAENKIVLIDFTGSDWCGWCIRLKKEVFSQPEFDAYAGEHLVLVEADFPHHEAQAASLQEANAALAKRFNIEGFPTLIALDGNGRQIGRLGYQPGGPQAMIAELNRISGNPNASSPPSGPGAQAKGKAVPPPAPLFNGAPTFPPPQFTELILKGLSGPKNNRLAMINNQTLGVNESVTMKVGGKDVKVKCLEIRQTSVMVSIDGSESREVRMRGGL